MTQMGVGAVGVRESVWNPEYGSIYMSKEHLGCRVVSCNLLQPETRCRHQAG